MNVLNNYIGIEPFTVNIDESAELKELAQKARQLRNMPFAEKLQSVKALALTAMVNAYEQMMVLGKEEEQLSWITVIGPNGKPDNSRYQKAKAEHAKYLDIVVQQHPLSHTLKQRAGCCRYQGALFFVLGYEAELGDKQFIQAAPVNRDLSSVFNDVIHNGQLQHVSIFTESLKDKSFDYSRQNPRVFEQAFESIPGYNFYSYHRTPQGLLIVSNPNEHIKEIP